MKDEQWYHLLNLPLHTGLLSGDQNRQSEIEDQTWDLVRHDLSIKIVDTCLQTFGKILSL